MKILVVEDEEKLAHYLKRALEEVGYAVEIISNGKDALYFIETCHQEIDAIILDILLPDTSGFQICKEIRKQHITTPILMLTAKDQEADKITGLDIGADDYMTKPFSLQELLARVRSLLRRSRGEINNKLKIQDLEINLESRQVFQNGKEVHLTYKEYELLTLLATHPNKAFEREQLLEQVWDMNFTTFSNIVDVHITHLRQKIHDTKEKNIIQSVRGVGYRLNL